MVALKHPHHGKSNIMENTKTSALGKQKADRKQEILNAYHQPDVNHRQNRMGADDAWYDVDYAITQVFTQEQVREISDDEIDHLVLLGERMSEMLY
jgi:hypothetical protein